jgi:uncharacterized caspase-like protein
MICAGFGFAMRILVGILVLLFVTGTACAERRVALVMGAGGYETIRPLKNAVSDAISMKGALEALGFEVFLETDRDLRRMRRALEDFAYDAENADVALVFFAGHGVEIGGENRLLPVDADASSLEALQKTTLPLEELRETVAQIAPIGLIVLDACRDDPFGAAASSGGRGATSLIPASLPETVKPGLGRMGRSENVLFAFSAAPGETASDGNGANSPFTTALTKYLGTDGLEIRSVLTLVQQEVYDQSRGRQLPYVESGLPQTFFATTTRDALPERERLLLAMAQVTPSIRDEIEKMAVLHDMPLAPLYGALIARPAAAESEPVLHKWLDEAARRYVSMREQIALVSPSDPEVARLRREAESAISLGAFDEAAQKIQAAIAIDTGSIERLKRNAVDRQRSFAANHVLLGGVRHSQADFFPAYDAYLTASGTYGELGAENLQSPDYAAWWDANIGLSRAAIYDVMDQFSGLLAQVQVQISRRRAELEPGSRQLADELVAAEAEWGRTAARQSRKTPGDIDPAEAGRAFARSLCIARTQAAANDGDAAWQFRLFYTLMWVAIYSGDREEDVAQATEVLEDLLAQGRLSQADAASVSAILSVEVPAIARDIYAPMISALAEERQRPCAIDARFMP